MGCDGQRWQFRPKTPPPVILRLGNLRFVGGGVVGGFCDWFVRCFWNAGVFFSVVHYLSRASVESWSSVSGFLQVCKFLEI